MDSMENKEINELVGGDMNSSGGDKVTTSDSEIETGPVDKPFNDNSDYEKGMSTTTDKVFGRYRQNIPWFAVYSYGGQSGAGRVKSLPENKPGKIVTKNSVEEKIEDLVKKSKDSGVTEKNYDSKFNKVLDMINNSDMSEEQLDKIKKALETKAINPNKTKNL